MTTRPRLPMPIRQRAKQFAMFDAMKGLTEAIAEKERQIYPEWELASDRIEEINESLVTLNYGDEISVEYYCQYDKSKKRVRGKVSKIDSFWKELHIQNLSISFSEIIHISTEYAQCHNTKE